MSSSRPAEVVTDMLSRLFGRYAEAAKKHGVYTLETIGDAYIVTCGLLWFISGILEYFMTKNFLNMNFIDEMSGYSINLFVTVFKTNGAMIGMMCAKFLIQ